MASNAASSIDNERVPYTLIRDLPVSERPRERLRDFGADALSVVELMAILLWTGSVRESVVEQAKRLLRDFHGIEGIEAYGELGQLEGALGGVVRLHQANPPEVDAGHALSYPAWLASLVTQQP